MSLYVCRLTHTHTLCAVFFTLPFYIYNVHVAKRVDPLIKHYIVNRIHSYGNSLFCKSHIMDFLLTYIEREQKTYAQIERESECKRIEVVC